MNESNLYQMPASLEYQCFQDDSQERVRLPLVHSKKRRLYQRANARKMAIAAMFFFKISVSVLTAWLVSLILIPAAYAERGYSAVGGEWTLIIATFALTYYAITSHINKSVNKTKKEQRYGANTR